MTETEMVSTVRLFVGDKRLDGLAEPYLGIAKSAVVSRLYPYRPEAAWSDVPERHHGRTCEIAAYLINRRGAEGEVSHSENGVSRRYGSASIPAALMDGITPFAGVPR